MRLTATEIATATTLAVLLILGLVVAIAGWPTDPIVQQLFLIAALAPWCALCVVRILQLERADRARRSLAHAELTNALIERYYPVSQAELNQPGYWKGGAAGAAFADEVVPQEGGDRSLTLMIQEFNGDIRLGTPDQVAYAKGWVRAALNRRDQLLGIGA